MIAAAVAALVAAPVPSSIDLVPPHHASPYELEVLPHALVTALTYGAALGMAVAVPELQGGPVCPEGPAQRCPAAGLNELDRLAVGKHSPEWRLVSDVAMWSLAGVVTAGVVLEALLANTDTPWRDLGVDVLVTAEALAMVTLAVDGLKFSVQRPRPTHYMPGQPTGSFEHRLSFPSGHSATAAGLAAAFTTSFFLRHPTSPWRWVVLAGGVATSLLVAAARVEGGRHFPTDVAGGLLIGGAIGFLVPWAHGAWEPWD